MVIGSLVFVDVVTAGRSSRMNCEVYRVGLSTLSCYTVQMDNDPMPGLDWDKKSAF